MPAGWLQRTKISEFSDAYPPLCPILETQVDTSGTAKAVVQSFNKMGLPYTEASAGLILSSVVPRIHAFYVHAVDKQSLPYLLVLRQTRQQLAACVGAAALGGARTGLADGTRQCSVSELALAAWHPPSTRFRKNNCRRTLGRSAQFWNSQHC